MRITACQDYEIACMRLSSVRTRLRIFGSASHGKSGPLITCGHGVWAFDPDIKKLGTRMSELSTPTSENIDLPNCELAVADIDQLTMCQAMIYHVFWKIPKADCPDLSKLSKAGSVASKGSFTSPSRSKWGFQAIKWLGCMLTSAKPQATQMTARSLEGFTREEYLTKPCSV